MIIKRDFVDCKIENFYLVKFFNYFSSFELYLLMILLSDELQLKYG